MKTFEEYWKMQANEARAQAVLGFNAMGVLPSSLWNLIFETEAAFLEYIIAQIEATTSKPTHLLRHALADVLKRDPKEEISKEGKEYHIAYWSGPSSSKGENVEAQSIAQAVRMFTERTGIYEEKIVYVSPRSKKV